MFENPDALGDALIQGKRGDAFKAELIAEMQTQETRAILYCADTSLHAEGEVGIEEYSYYADQFDTPHKALDCEDMAMHIMERSYNLKHTAFTRAPWLLKLQAFEKRYTTYFTIVTLNVMGKWNYHVVVIKLDSRYNFKSDGSEQKYLPSVLIDPTIYSTSCYAHDSKGMTNEECYSRSQETGWPWSCHTKIPTSRIKKMKSYGHVILLVCPERRDCVRLDLTDSGDGKRGVRIETLLDYGDCIAEKTPLDAAELNRFKYMPQHLPTWVPLNAELPIWTHGTVTSAPLVDLTFRKVDWNDRVLHTLEHDEKLKGKEFHIFQQEITTGLHSVRAVVW
jgi:hypothetical protein